MLAFLTGHGEVQKGESTNRQVVTRSAPSLLAEGSEKASPQPHVLMVVTTAQNPMFLGGSFKCVVHRALETMSDIINMSHV